MVKRLENLIGIFENPALDFSKNRAEHDDILGDAYEYLMRHFATQSGKSKGMRIFRLSDDAVWPGPGLCLVVEAVKSRFFLSSPGTPFRF